MACVAMRKALYRYPLCAEFHAKLPIWKLGHHSGRAKMPSDKELDKLVLQGIEAGTQELVGFMRSTALTEKNLRKTLSIISSLTWPAGNTDRPQTFVCGLLLLCVWI